MKVSGYHNTISSYKTYILFFCDQISEPNIISIYDIFARLITMSWLSRSSSAAAGELRDNQDTAIRRANMSCFFIT